MPAFVPSTSQGIGAGAIPAEVAEACHLILGAFAISALSLLPTFDALSNEQWLPFLILTCLVALAFLGLTLWLVGTIRKGKNWGRWAMLVLLGAGWVWVGVEAPEQWPRSALVALSDIAATCMEVFACWLLFTGRGKLWFSAERSGHEP